MSLDKFTQGLKNYSEKISLVHVILLSGLFALISIVNMHGGVLHPEMEIRLPFYMSKTPLLNKLFDSYILDLGFYRARELSYFFDFIDCKFIEFSIECGFPHFLSLTHYFFSITIGSLLWLFCVKELKLKPLMGIGLLALFWTSPSIFLGGNIFRTAKAGVALLIAILFYVIYKVATASIEGIPSKISKKIWILYFIAILTITFFDEQGLYFAFIALVFLMIWSFVVRHRNLYIMVFIGVSSVLFHILYKYAIAPRLTFLFNGYWPDFSYIPTVPITYFLKNLGSCLSAGLFLYVETLRFLVGNPPLLAAYGLLVFFISFPFFYVKNTSGLSANYRKFFIQALIGLLITNFFLIIVMNALMLLKKPDLLSEHGITLTYYTLPTNVLLAMTLVMLTNFFLKLRVPKGVVLTVMFFAVAGNIVALHKNNIIIRQGDFIGLLKNIDSWDDVHGPFEQHPIIQFFKSKNKNIKMGATAYNEKGIFYYNRGQFRLAIRNFNKAVTVNRNDVQSYIYRGNLYLKLQQFKQAIEDSNEVIRLKPDFAFAYNTRGSAYLNQNKNDLGCLDLQKACELGDCFLLKIAKDKGYCP